MLVKHTCESDPIIRPEIPKWVCVPNLVHQGTLEHHFHL